MKELHQWYQKYGRHDLPWRKTTDPYRIYLSELMLQQTQVERVIGYYDRFLSRFPSLLDVAQANEEEILALWSGLGYYSRARNLHKCAKISQGILPTSYEELLRLPGIGEYTASAICAFAYHQPYPTLDTNVKRVLKRYLALKNDKKLFQEAQKLLNSSHPKTHNLALMDLGAMICTPKNPQCALCPLNETCQGKSDPLLYTQSKKSSYQKLELFLGIAIQEQRLALIKSDTKLYENMLILPPIDPDPKDYIATIRHSYTKYRISAHLYHSKPPKKAVWIELDAIDEAPISSLTKKALQVTLSIFKANP